VLQQVMSTILHVLSRAKAEELAKAQYAERRDPHVCALLYIALGKKSLLQGAAAVAVKRGDACAAGMESHREWQGVPQTHFDVIAEVPLKDWK